MANRAQYKELSRREMFAQKVAACRGIPAEQFNRKTVDVALRKAKLPTTEGSNATYYKIKQLIEGERKFGGAPEISSNGSPKHSKNGEMVYSNKTKLKVLKRAIKVCGGFNELKELVELAEEFKSLGD